MVVVEEHGRTVVVVEENNRKCAGSYGGEGVNLI